MGPALQAVDRGGGRLLSVHEVAVRLGGSTALVYRLCDGGHLPHIRVSNAIRVLVDDLEEYVSRHRT